MSVAVIDRNDVVLRGRLSAPAELRARFDAAGAESGHEAVAYCGSGVTACVVVLAAEVAGKNRKT